MDQNRNWPSPIERADGCSKSWVVATLAFNGAAKIGMDVQNNGWSFTISPEKFDDRACYLVGFYDRDYDSFHINLCFDDGEKQQVYNICQQTKPASYQDVLNLMLLWQSIASTNAASVGHTGREVPELTNIQGYDPLLYKNTL